MQGFVFRKLADRSGEKAPDESWPMLGIRVEGEAPTEARIPTSTVERAAGEGWMTLEGERIVRRPAGPAGDRWRSTHTFTHLNALTIHTVDGDLRYKVTHQPDKYAAEGDDRTPVTGELYTAGATRVDWFYELELER
jgi:hypothetical protein